MARLHLPAGFDDVDAAFLESHSTIPDGSLVEGAVTVVSYLDPEEGEQRWAVTSRFEIPVSQVVGLLEMAKLELLARTTRAVTNLSPDTDDDDHG